MKLSLQACLISGVFFGSVLVIAPSEAQIVPDRTLPNNSQVTQQDNVNTITGGTPAGTNLFHSFEQFSIPTGGTARFENADAIQNIFSRVTGSSISNIDGLIRANGTTNLFLLNPNGIIFGSNASLNIGGSFLGTTANSIKFADGIEFSTGLPQESPLLTVNVPVGLQFGGKQGSISVRGNGHDVVALNYQPLISRGNSPSKSLKVQPRKTLALVGGDMRLEGGILNAESGRIELGSVGQGLVSLNSISSGWSLNYDRVSAFKDITLSQRSLVDVSGAGRGSIQVEGRKLQLNDASLLLNQNQGILPAETIKVNASESIELKGFEPYSFDPSRGLVSGIWSETLGLANGADISVSTPKLLFQSSGQIYSATVGSAKAGNINLSVPQSLQLVGLSVNETGGGVSISSFSLGGGSSGDINISTGQLKITNGGYVLTSNLTPITLGEISGESGSININATDIEVVGIAADLSLPSAISAATASTGKAGDVIVNTGSLKVSNGGRIDSSTGASGSAGNVIVNASNRVEVTGFAYDFQNPSLVISAASTVSEDLQQLLRLPPAPSGNAGNVIINTNRLIVEDGAQLSVRNDGTGRAGTLQVNGSRIKLDKSGSITATSTSGEGGDIFLNSRNLQLQKGSTISATAGLAGSGGNGGNIAIDTDTLTALNGSSITANAFTGNGGNIDITTQGLFLASNSQISAGSTLGVDGLVRINIPELDFTKVSQPEQQPRNPQLAIVCQGQADVAAGELVDAGTEATPYSLSDPLNSSSGWHDTKSYPQGSNKTAQLASSHPISIVEAQGWKQNDNGTVSFTTETDDIVPYSSLSSPACVRPQSRSEQLSTK